MARFSARPTMPPRAMCASFLSRVQTRYLSAAALASASGSGLSCGRMTSGPGPSRTGSSAARTPRAGVVAIVGLSSELCRGPRGAVHPCGSAPFGPLLASRSWPFRWTPGASSPSATASPRRRADYADCYFEFRVTQTASLEDGVVKKATRSIQQGVGVRVLAGPRTGYAYSDEVTLERLELAARTAQHIADRSAAPAVAALMPARVPHDLYPVVPPPIE